MDYESQLQRAKDNARSLKQTWYLIKFPNMTSFRAVSGNFFVSQPQLKQHIVETINPPEW